MTSCEILSHQAPGKKGTWKSTELRSVTELGTNPVGFDQSVPAAYEGGFTRHLTLGGLVSHSQEQELRR